ncbi:hypothetical protein ACHAXR_009286 [Thalassiosira sp. AJA248-18]
MLPSRRTPTPEVIEDAGPSNPSRPQFPHPDEASGNIYDLMMSSMFGGDSSNLQDGCAETNWRGLPAQKLFLTSMKHDVDGLRKLLLDPTMRKLVNDKDGDKSGILHSIVLNKVSDTSSQIIKMLVDAGCNPDMKGGQAQETALEIAATYSRYKHVEALLAAGARVDVSDFMGGTPLMTARRVSNAKGTDDARRTLELIEEAHSTIQNDTSRIELADKIRQEGNKAFGMGRYRHARQLYSDSINTLEDHRSYSNRALCCLKIGRQIFETHGKYEKKPDGTYYTNYPVSIRAWGDEVVTDAGCAVKMNDEFEKSHYRLVLGHAMRKDFPRAKMACQEGLQKFPHSDELGTALDLFERLHTPDCIATGTAALEADRLVDEGCDACQCSYCAKIQPYYEEKTICVACGMDMGKYEPGVFAPLILNFIMGYK